MAKVTALDRVVKLVEANYKPSYSKEKIVILDFKKGTVLKGKPLISFKDLRYYSVSLQRSVECEGLVCNVRDIETKHSINIKIDYDVSCSEGNQNKLVKAIYKRDNPKLAIEEYIEQWVKTFNKDKRKANVNIINTFFEEKEALKKFIVNKALSVLGLDIHLFISLEGEELLNPIKKSSENFPIRVADYDHNIFIKYEIGLEVPEDSYKINAILNYNQLPKLPLLIKNEIEKFMIKDCTLHELCFQFNSKIKSKILQRLNGLLKEYGRKVSFIKFDLQLSDLLLPESPLITHVSKCKIKESPTLIEIENRVLLKLIDIGKFRRSNIDNLENWLQRKLDKISQEVLFERDRIDLIRNLDEDKLLIQEKLQQESLKIGYHIKHLASLPDLDELTLKQGFKVEQESSFKTKDNYEINLEVIVNAKVLNFEGIESLLKDGVKIFKEQIIERSKDIIEQEIREKYLSEIYKSAFEGENSIDNIVKSKIETLLEDTFNLTDLRVSILFLDTDLSDRMRGLMASFPNFEFEVVAKDISIKIPYRVSYKIVAVDPNKYDTFLNNNFKADTIDLEIEKINEYLINEIIYILKPIPGKMLLDGSIVDIKKLELLIEERIRTVTSNVFGLILGSEIRILRLETKLEEKSVLKTEGFIELGVSTELEIADNQKVMLMDSLSLLYEQEKYLLKGGDKKGAKKVKKQIEELVKKNTNYMDQYSEMNKALGPSSKDEDTTATLGDYLSENNLLEAPKEKNNKSKDNDIYED